MYILIRFMVIASVIHTGACTVENESIAAVGDSLTLVENTLKPVSSDAEFAAFDEAVSRLKKAYRSMGDAEAHLGRLIFERDKGEVVLSQDFDKAVRKHRFALSRLNARFADFNRLNRPIPVSEIKTLLEKVRQLNSDDIRAQTEELAENLLATAEWCDTVKSGRQTVFEDIAFAGRLSQLIGVSKLMLQSLIDSGDALVSKSDFNKILHEHMRSSVAVQKESRRHSTALSKALTCEKHLLCAFHTLKAAYQRLI